MDKIVDKCTADKKLINDPNNNNNQNKIVITPEVCDVSSSSSSHDPQSESSLTDPGQDINLDNISSHLYSDTLNENYDRESVKSGSRRSHKNISDIISSDDSIEDFVSVASGADSTWEENWLFKKRKLLTHPTAPIGMLVPAPREDIRAMIGDKSADELSDFSDNEEDDYVNGNKNDSGPENDRIQNKTVIGGQNTVGLFNDFIKETSLTSRSNSSNDNHPSLVETKNDYVDFEYGLNVKENPSLDLTYGGVPIKNEAVNMAVSVDLLRNEQETNENVEGQKNDARTAENLSQTSNNDIEIPNPSEEQLIPDNSSRQIRRPSTIEFLAAIALGPVLTVCSPDINEDVLKTITNTTDVISILTKSSDISSEIQEEKYFDIENANSDIPCSPSVEATESGISTPVLKQINSGYVTPESGISTPILKQSRSTTPTELVKGSPTKQVRFNDSPIIIKRGLPKNINIDNDELNTAMINDSFIANVFVDHIIKTIEEKKLSNLENNKDNNKINLSDSEISSELNDTHAIPLPSDVLSNISLLLSDVDLGPLKEELLQSVSPVPFDTDLDIYICPPPPVAETEMKLSRFSVEFTKSENKNVEKINVLEKEKKQEEQSFQTQLIESENLSQNTNTTNFESNNLVENSSQNIEPYNNTESLKQNDRIQKDEETNISTNDCTTIETCIVSNKVEEVKIIEDNAKNEIEESVNNSKIPTFETEYVPDKENTIIKNEKPLVENIIETIFECSSADNINKENTSIQAEINNEELTQPIEETCEILHNTIELENKNNEIKTAEEIIKPNIVESMENINSIEQQLNVEAFVPLNEEMNTVLEDNHSFDINSENKEEIISVEISSDSQTISIEMFEANVKTNNNVIESHLHNSPLNEVSLENSEIVEQPETISLTKQEVEINSLKKPNSDEVKPVNIISINQNQINEKNSITETDFQSDSMHTSKSEVIIDTANVTSVGNLQENSENTLDRGIEEGSKSLEKPKTINLINETPTITNDVNNSIVPSISIENKNNIENKAVNLKEKTDTNEISAMIINKNSTNSEERDSTSHNLNESTAIENITENEMNEKIIEPMLPPPFEFQNSLNDESPTTSNDTVPAEVANDINQIQEVPSKDKTKIEPTIASVEETNEECHKANLSQDLVPEVKGTQLPVETSIVEARVKGEEVTEAFLSIILSTEMLKRETEQTQVTERNKTQLPVEISVVEAKAEVEVVTEAFLSTILSNEILRKEAQSAEIAELKETQLTAEVPLVEHKVEVEEVTEAFLSTILSNEILKKETQLADIEGTTEEPKEMKTSGNTSPVAKPLNVVNVLASSAISSEKTEPYQDIVSEPQNTQETATIVSNETAINTAQQSTSPLDNIEEPPADIVTTVNSPILTAINTVENMKAHETPAAKPIESKDPVATTPVKSVDINKAEEIRLLNVTQLAEPQEPQVVVAALASTEISPDKTEPYQDIVPEPQTIQETAIIVPVETAIDTAQQPESPLNNIEEPPAGIVTTANAPTVAAIIVVENTKAPETPAAKPIESKDPVATTPVESVDINKAEEIRILNVTQLAEPQEPQVVVAALASTEISPDKTESYQDIVPKPENIQETVTIVPVETATDTAQQPESPLSNIEEPPADIVTTANAPTVTAIIVVENTKAPETPAAEPIESKESVAITSVENTVDVNKSEEIPLLNVTQPAEPQESQVAVAVQTSTEITPDKTEPYQDIVPEPQNIQETAIIVPVETSIDTAQQSESRLNNREEPPADIVTTANAPTVAAIIVVENTKAPETPAAAPIESKDPVTITSVENTVDINKSEEIPLLNVNQPAEPQEPQVVIAVQTSTEITPDKTEPYQDIVPEPQNIQETAIIVPVETAIDTAQQPESPLNNIEEPPADIVTTASAPTVAAIDVDENTKAPETPAAEPIESKDPVATTPVKSVDINKAEEIRLINVTQLAEPQEPQVTVAVQTSTEITPDKTEPYQDIVPEPQNIQETATIVPVETATGAAEHSESPVNNIEEPPADIVKAADAPTKAAIIVVKNTKAPETPAAAPSESKDPVTITSVENTVDINKSEEIPLLNVNQPAEPQEPQVVIAVQTSTEITPDQTEPYQDIVPEPQNIQETAIIVPVETAIDTAQQPESPLNNIEEPPADIVTTVNAPTVAAIDVDENTKAPETPAAEPIESKEPVAITSVENTVDVNKSEEIPLLNVTQPAEPQEPQVAVAVQTSTEITPDKTEPYQDIVPEPQHIQETATIVPVETATDTAQQPESPVINIEEPPADIVTAANAPTVAAIIFVENTKAPETPAAEPIESKDPVTITSVENTVDINKSEEIPLLNVNQPAEPQEPQVVIAVQTSTEITPDKTEPYQDIVPEPQNIQETAIIEPVHTTIDTAQQPEPPLNNIEEPPADILTTANAPTVAAIIVVENTKAPETAAAEPIESKEPVAITSVENTVDVNKSEEIPLLNITQPAEPQEPQVAVAVQTSTEITTDKTEPCQDIVPEPQNIQETATIVPVETATDTAQQPESPLSNIEEPPADIVTTANTPTVAATIVVENTKVPETPAAEPILSKGPVAITSVENTVDVNTSEEIPLLNVTQPAEPQEPQVVVAVQTSTEITPDKTEPYLDIVPEPQNIQETATIVPVQTAIDTAQQPELPLYNIEKPLEDIVTTANTPTVAATIGVENTKAPETPAAEPIESKDLVAITFVENTVDINKAEEIPLLNVTQPAEPQEPQVVVAVQTNTEITPDKTEPYPDIVSEPQNIQETAIIVPVETATDTAQQTESPLKNIGKPPADIVTTVNAPTVAAIHVAENMKAPETLAAEPIESKDPVAITSVENTVGIKKSEEIPLLNVTEPIAPQEPEDVVAVQTSTEITPDKTEPYQDIVPQPQNIQETATNVPVGSAIDTGQQPQSPLNNIEEPPADIVTAANAPTVPAINIVENTKAPETPGAEPIESKDPVAIVPVENTVEINKSEEIPLLNLTQPAELQEPQDVVAVQTTTEITPDKTEPYQDIVSEPQKIQETATNVPVETSIDTAQQPESPLNNIEESPADIITTVNAPTVAAINIVENTKTPEIPGAEPIESKDPVAIVPVESTVEINKSKEIPLLNITEPAELQEPQDVVAVQTSTEITPDKTEPYQDIVPEPQNIQETATNVPVETSIDTVQQPESPLNNIEEPPADIVTTVNAPTVAAIIFVENTKAPETPAAEPIESKDPVTITSVENTVDINKSEEIPLLNVTQPAELQEPQDVVAVQTSTKITPDKTEPYQDIVQEMVSEPQILQEMATIEPTVTTIDTAQQLKSSVDNMEEQTKVVLTTVTAPIEAAIDIVKETKVPEISDGVSIKSKEAIACEAIQNIVDINQSQEVPLLIITNPEKSQESDTIPSAEALLNIEEALIKTEDPRTIPIDTAIGITKKLELLQENIKKTIEENLKPERSRNLIVEKKVQGEEVTEAFLSIILSADILKKETQLQKVAELKRTHLSAEIPFVESKVDVEVTEAFLSTILSSEILKEDTQKLKVYENIVEQKIMQYPSGIKVEKENTQENVTNSQTPTNESSSNAEFKQSHKEELAQETVKELKQAHMSVTDIEKQSNSSIDLKIETSQPSDLSSSEKNSIPDTDNYINTFESSQITATEDSQVDSNIDSVDILDFILPPPIDFASEDNYQNNEDEVSAISQASQDSSKTELIIDFVENNSNILDSIEENYMISSNNLNLISSNESTNNDIKSETTLYDKDSEIIKSAIESTEQNEAEINKNLNITANIQTETITSEEIALGINKSSPTKISPIRIHSKLDFSQNIADVIEAVEENINLTNTNTVKTSIVSNLSIESTPIEETSIPEINLKASIANIEETEAIKIINTNLISTTENAPDLNNEQKNAIEKIIVEQKLNEDLEEVISDSNISIIDENYKSLTYNNSTQENPSDENKIETIPDSPFRDSITIQESEISSAETSISTQVEEYHTAMDIYLECSTETKETDSLDDDSDNSQILLTNPKEISNNTIMIESEESNENTLKLESAGTQQLPEEIDMKTNLDDIQQFHTLERTSSDSTVPDESNSTILDTKEEAQTQSNLIEKNSPTTTKIYVNGNIKNQNSDNVSTPFTTLLNNDNKIVHEESLIKLDKNDSNILDNKNSNLTTNNNNDNDISILDTTNNITNSNCDNNNKIKNNSIDIINNNENSGNGTNILDNNKNNEINNNICINNDSNTTLITNTNQIPKLIDTKNAEVFCKTLDISDDEEHNINLIPGSIAEREHKKWYNAVEMPNNPYAPEALLRRLDNGPQKPFDIPTGTSVANTTIKTPEEEITNDEVKLITEKAADLSKYSRDYYVPSPTSNCTKNHQLIRTQQIEYEEDELKELDDNNNNNSNKNHEDETSIKKVSDEIIQNLLGEGNLNDKIKIYENNISLKNSNGSTSSSSINNNDNNHYNNSNNSNNNDIYSAKLIEINDSTDDEQNKNEIKLSPISLLSSDKLKSDYSSISDISLQNSLTLSEDSDTLRIYNLNKQETTFVLKKENPPIENQSELLNKLKIKLDYIENNIELTNTPPNTPITPLIPTLQKNIPKAPRIRPNDLKLESVTSQSPTKNSGKTAMVLTPQSFKFLHPKRKIIEPCQILIQEPITTPPETPDKTVIEEDVVHSLPSVKALAKAFLLTSGKCSTTHQKTRPKSLYIESSNNSEIKNEIKKSSSHEFLAPPPVPKKICKEAKKEDKNQSNISIAERPLSPVLTPGKLKDNIAFFENLKKI